MSSLQKTSVYAFKCLLITYNVCGNMYVSRVYQHVTEKSPWLKKVEDSASTAYLVKSIFDIFYEMQFIMVSDTMSLMSLLQRKKCLYFPFQKNSGNTGCSIENLTYLISAKWIIDQTWTKGWRSICLYWHILILCKINCMIQEYCDFNNTVSMYFLEDTRVHSR